MYHYHTGPRALVLTGVLVYLDLSQFYKKRLSIAKKKLCWKEFSVLGGILILFLFGFKAIQFLLRTVDRFLRSEIVKQAPKLEPAPRADPRFFEAAF